MKTFGERLKIAIEARGLNNNSLAVKVGVHATTVKNWLENERAKPDPTKLDKAIEVLNINKDWLINGKSEMNLPNIEIAPSGKFPRRTPDPSGDIKVYDVDFMAGNAIEMFVRNS